MWMTLAVLFLLCHTGVCAQPVRLWYADGHTRIDRTRTLWYDAGESILYSTENGNVLRWDVGTGRFLDRTQITATVAQVAALTDSTYAAVYDGGISCHRLADGMMIWKKTIEGSLLWADRLNGYARFRTPTDGDVYVNLRTGEPLATRRVAQNHTDILFDTRVDGVYSGNRDSLVLYRMDGSAISLYSVPNTFICTVRPVDTTHTVLLVQHKEPDPGTGYIAMLYNIDVSSGTITDSLGLTYGPYSDQFDMHVVGDRLVVKTSARHLLYVASATFERGTTVEMDQDIRRIETLPNGIVLVMLNDGSIHRLYANGSYSGIVTISGKVSSATQLNDGRLVLSTAWRAPHVVRIHNGIEVGPLWNTPPVEARLQGVGLLAAAAAPLVAVQLPSGVPTEDGTRLMDLAILSTIDSITSCRYVHKESMGIEYSRVTPAWISPDGTSCSLLWSASGTLSQHAGESGTWFRRFATECTDNTELGSLSPGTPDYFRYITVDDGHPLLLHVAANGSVAVMGRQRSGLTHVFASNTTLRSIADIEQGIVSADGARILADHATGIQWLRTNDAAYSEPVDLGSSHIPVEWLPGENRVITRQGTDICCINLTSNTLDWRITGTDAIRRAIVDRQSQWFLALYDNGTTALFALDAAVSVNEHTTSHVGVAPNPSTGHVRITIPAGTLSCVIYDAIGRVSATLPTDMEHVMLENLATGTYFVVATGKRVVTTSFVVTR